MCSKQCQSVCCQHIMLNSYGSSMQWYMPTRFSSWFITDVAAVAVVDMCAFLAGQCDRGSSRWKRICRASDKLCIIGTWHERMHCRKLGIIGPIVECFRINAGFKSPETLLGPLKSLITARQLLGPVCVSVDYICRSIILNKSK